MKLLKVKKHKYKFDRRRALECKFIEIAKEFKTS
jgi:hypothetical protein